MADLSVTAVGRTMMASHVSERGVPIMMTRAAATIDSFDLHRMGRLHQVLAEMLREDVDVKHASDLMDQLERESFALALVDRCSRGEWCLRPRSLCKPAVVWWLLL